MVQLPTDAEQEDVMLSTEVICGKCSIRMNEIAAKKFECVKCKYIYTD